MRDKRVLYPLLAIAVLILAALACGTENTGETVGQSAPQPTSPPPQVSTYNIGDIVQVQDHTVTLNSAEFQGNILKANFTFENQGSSDLPVSSLLAFEAKDSEGTKLELEIFDCGSQLDGSVLPGDKLRGDICWKGATSDVKIYYRANFLGSGAIVWEIKK